MKKIALILVLIFGMCGSLYAQETVSSDIQILFLKQRIQILEQQIKIRDLQQEAMERTPSELDIAAEVGASANSYDVNTTPSATADYLLGIDDFGEGSWAVQRFNIANLRALFLASASITIKRYYPATLTDTSTPHDLTIAECSNTLITTQGWNGTDDITFNLPDISAYDGTEGVLIVRFRDTVGMQDADTDFYIDPDAATQITLNTVITGTDGDRIWNDNIGIYEGIICMSDYDGTLAGYWICDTVSGAWMDKGS